MGETVSDADLFEREQSLTHDDVINMQYTSGTTGFPKGVMLTHYNIVNNAAIVADRMGLTSEDRLCIPVPLFHCFGCVLSTLACVASGAPSRQSSNSSRTSSCKRSKKKDVQGRRVYRQCLSPSSPTPISQTMTSLLCGPGSWQAPRALEKS
nr:AMP-binding protein [Bacillus licheniformis]